MSISVHILLESLDGELRRSAYVDEIVLRYGAGGKNECLLADVVTVIHPDRSEEEVTRLYGIHHLSAGTAGPRVYRELSPNATLRVLRGEVCAAHWADKRVGKVCACAPAQHLPLEESKAVA